MQRIWETFQTCMFAVTSWNSNVRQHNGQRRAVVTTSKVKVCDSEGISSLSPSSVKTSHCGDGSATSDITIWEWTSYSHNSIFYSTVTNKWWQLIRIRLFVAFLQLWLILLRESVTLLLICIYNALISAAVNDKLLIFSGPASHLVYSSEGLLTDSYC